MGEAESGQRIHAQSVAFGIPWNVDVLVEQVDVSRHTLDLMTTIPFGITLLNHITCTELDPSSCQVSFS
jgi:hypothetical protein